MRTLWFTLLFTLLRIGSAPAAPTQPAAKVAPPAAPVSPEPPPSTEPPPSPATPAPTTATVDDPDDNIQIGVNYGRAFEKDHHYTGYEAELDFPVNRYFIPYAGFLAYKGDTPRTGEDGTIDYESIIQLNAGVLFASSFVPSQSSRMVRNVRLTLRAGLGFEFYNDGLNDDNSGGVSPVLTLGTGLRVSLGNFLALSIELSGINYPSDLTEFQMV